MKWSSQSRMHTACISICCCLTSLASQTLSGLGGREPGAFPIHYILVFTGRLFQYTIYWCSQADFSNTLYTGVHRQTFQWHVNDWRSVATKHPLTCRNVNALLYWGFNLNIWMIQLHVRGKQLHGCRWHSRLPRG